MSRPNSRDDNGEGFSLPILACFGWLMCGEWIVGAVCFAALAAGSLAVALARN
jgi:hypothetical protein